MALEDRARQHDQQVVDKFHDPNGNYEMTTRDYVLRPLANATSGPITIKLPPVAEAKGRFYSIVARGATGVNTITVVNRNDSEYWPANPYVLNAAGKRLVLYSDGRCWFAVCAEL